MVISSAVEHAVYTLPINALYDACDLSNDTVLSAHPAALFPILRATHAALDEIMCDVRWFWDSRRRIR